MPLRWIGVCLAAAAWVAANAAPSRAPADGVTVVELKPFGTQPAVEVLVNGRGPYLFLVDTGASGVARIDSSVLSALQLPIVGTAQASGATGGAPVTVKRVSVQSLRVGNREYAGLTPLSRSYNVEGDYVPNIGGILALNLFADELLTIDFPKRLLRIERGSLPQADGRTIFRYEANGDLIHLPIRIGGEQLTALVDTGTDRSIDLPTSAVRRLRLATFPHPVGRATGVTNTVPISEAAIDGDLVIGSHRIRDPSVTFSDSFEFPILGSVLLHDFAVTIDQRNHRIRLVRGAPRRD